jgi:hypothetical protein
MTSVGDKTPILRASTQRHPYHDRMSVDDGRRSIAVDTVNLWLDVINGHFLIVVRGLTVFVFLVTELRSQLYGWVCVRPEK